MSGEFADGRALLWVGAQRAANKVSELRIRALEARAARRARELGVGIFSMTENEGDDSDAPDV